MLQNISSLYKASWLTASLLLTFAASGCGKGTGQDAAPSTASSGQDAAETKVSEKEALRNIRQEKATVHSGPDLKKLTVAELIDKLQEESNQGTGTHATAWTDEFLAFDEEPRFDGGVLGSQKPTRSRTMQELVRRGIKALPQLLDHLSDARTTKLLVGAHGFHTGKWHSNEYSPRYRDSKKQPAGVCIDHSLTYTKDVDQYTLRVGDLCYVAVGQIVNRSLSAVRYQPTACLVINSPVETPALAEAARKDWSGLTAEEHKEGLLADTVEYDDSGAVKRLWYWYPEDGRKMALRMLSRPVYSNRTVGGFTYDTLMPIKEPEQWKPAIENFGKRVGKAEERGVLFYLLHAYHFPKSQSNERVEAWRSEAARILKHVYPHVDPEKRPFIDAVDTYAQTRLIEALQAIPSDEIDQAVKQVFLAIDLKRYEGFDRVTADSLALACMDRLDGKGMDKEFAAYCKTRIEELKQRQREIAEEQSQVQKLRSYFRERAAPAAIREAWRELARLRDEEQRLVESIPTTMVMEELPSPRPTHVLIRGAYDKPAERVSPGVPSVFNPSATPANRLEFARWLVHPANPLTARVAVNRFWQLFFGVGLVKTVEDFGVQGEWPSHPELLDWLATELVRSGWDVKALQRLIVTSAAYRQSSRATPALLQADPENRLLARGPRLRLPAEMVRDQALAASGLLVERLGGPSVKPYQPAGLWKDLTGTEDYVQDHGTSLYRRSLYTFWKRTVPPPVMVTFDAAGRETCIVRETRTNTPLQALNLMNDVTYVEAARVLAQRVMHEAGPAPEERVALAFRLATARPPKPTELKILVDAFQHHVAEYRKDRQAAVKLTSAGESPRDEKLDVAEWAAYTAVAGMVLNLDEVVTRE